MQCSIEEAFSMFFVPWQENETELELTVDKGVTKAERCKVVDTSPGNRWYVKISFTRSGDRTILDIGAATSFSYEDWRGRTISGKSTRKMDVLFTRRASRWTEFAVCRTAAQR